MFPFMIFFLQHDIPKSMAVGLTRVGYNVIRCYFTAYFE